MKMPMGKPILNDDDAADDSPMDEEAVEEELPQQDPRRAFSSLQKNKIFLQQGRKCIVCKQPLNPFQAVYYHKRWVKGGRTITKNGRAAHPECLSR